MPAAAHLRAISACCQRLTLRDTRRIVPCMFSIALVQASARPAHLQWGRGGSRQKPSNDVSGLEALVYRDRERGKSYLHALFD